MSDSRLIKALGPYQGHFYLILRIALGGLFIFASLDKIWNPGLFANAVSNYRILPLALLHITAIILPWLELIIGMALIVNVYQRAANIILGGLLIIFTLAVSAAMLRGLDFNCGCFDLNATSSNLGLRKIFENLGLICGTILLDLHFRRAAKPGITSKTD